MSNDLGYQIKDDRVISVRHEELLSEIRSTLSVACSSMALPLYMVFWFCDLLYAPDQKWTFLAFRVITTAGIYGVFKKINRDKTSEQGLMTTLFLAGWMSAFITSMIFLTTGSSSPYYAGLNLIGIGMLSFIPWPNKYFIAATIFPRCKELQTIKLA